MNRRIPRLCNLLLVVGLFLFVTQFAHAGDVSRFSGSYRVVHESDLGSDTHVQLQIQLMNHGQRDVQIRRLTLWDSPHPDKDSDKNAAQPCSIVIHRGASASTTQEFTIRRQEYRLWARGAHPRLLLEVQLPDSRTVTEVVRLNPASSKKGN